MKKNGIKPKPLPVIPAGVPQISNNQPPAQPPTNHPPIIQPPASQQPIMSAHNAPIEPTCTTAATLSSQTTSSSTTNQADINNLINLMDKI